MTETAAAEHAAPHKHALGEIFVMKGKGYEPRAPGRGGPLHRSPPIEARGVKRLVCTLTLP